MSKLDSEMSYLSNLGYFGICPAEFHTTAPWKVTIKWVDCGLLSHTCSAVGVGMLRWSCLPFEPLVFWCCRGSGVTLWSAVHNPISCSVSKPCFLLVLCNEDRDRFLYGNLRLGLLGTAFSPQTCSARHWFKELAKHLQFPQILWYLELLYNCFLLLLLSGASARWHLCHVEVSRTLLRAVIHLVAQLA